MALRYALRHPLNSGGGSSTLVPHPWDCAINGRTYLFDTKYFGTAQHTLSSIKLLKPQQTSEVGEDALNPADGIRAKIDSWHYGAGQTSLDRDESDPYRFRSSKGVDPWTKHRLSLLPDTDQKVSTSGTNLVLVVAGARLYFQDGQNLKYVTDLDADSPTVTTVSSTPAAAGTGLASDGYTVWSAHGASGIYDTNTSTGAAASRTTGTVGGPLGYVKGRLMAANTNSIYNITSLSGAAAALPAALFTHANTDFRWVGFAEGLNNIYAAGYSGDKSLVYRTAVKADGTALDVPVVAGELPDGEIVRSIGSYLGVVLLGTDKGWWTAAQDSSGNLTLNKVQDTSSAVNCFEGQGDFVWFGWTNYDSTSTGLGRADLKSDTKGGEVITPAYASDLMISGQGAVLSVASFDNRRVFAVSGLGIYAQADTKVASGTIDSGLITHGVPDRKVALSVTLAHEPLDGTIATALAADEGSFTTLGTSSTADTTESFLTSLSTAGKAFEVRHTLTRSSGDSTQGPVLTRVTLESNYAPGRGQRFAWALLFFEELERDGTRFGFDPVSAFEDLLSIEANGVPVTLQHALGSVTARLEDHDFLIEGWTSDRRGYRGTVLTEWSVPRSRG